MEYLNLFFSLSAITISIISAIKNWKKDRFILNESLRTRVASLLTNFHRFENEAKKLENTVKKLLLPQDLEINRQNLLKSVENIYHSTSMIKRFISPYLDEMDNPYSLSKELQKMEIKQKEIEIDFGNIIDRLIELESNIN